MDDAVYFCILDSRTRSRKPVLVKHHASADDAVATAPLAFLVQYLSVWRSHNASEIIAYEDSDPEWVPSDQLGSWANLSGKLMHWKAAASDTDGCIEMSCPRPADTFFFC